jgi:hypothetical protein
MELASSRWDQPPDSEFGVRIEPGIAKKKRRRKKMLHVEGTYVAVAV